MLMPGMVYKIQKHDANYLVTHGMAFTIEKNDLKLKSNDKPKTRAVSKKRPKTNKRSGSSGDSGRAKKQPSHKRVSNK